jgi:hypothetical protein
MSVKLSIDGPHFTSGQIKFSDIRSKFGGGNNFGSYKRNTDTDATDPIVPEATENSAISTGTNLKFSQFRGSVKSYTATQSGTDENTSTATWPGFRMGNYFTSNNQYGLEGTGIQWNGNLNKNIKKTVNITGTCGSRTTTHPAAQLDPISAIYNLTINVLAGARILGARGSGGIANGGNGGNGGIGLRVYNTGAKNLIVSVKSGALVAGGGGGGGAGTVGGTGGQGGDGLADGGTTTVYGQPVCNLEAVAGGNPVCQVGSGQELVSQDFQGESPKGVFQWLCCRRSVSIVDNADIPTTGGIGGPGGNGGNGGNGEGYDGTDLSVGLGVGAVTDWAGKTGGTNAGNGGPGGTGGNGGAGGTFGANGNPGNQGNTGDPGSSGNVTGGSAGTAGGLPVGNGGIAGKAIDGLNYILNPSPPPSGTIRGNNI